MNNMAGMNTPFRTGDIDLEEIKRQALPSLWERSLKVHFYRFLIFIVFLGTWQLISGRFIPTNWIANPQLVAEKGWAWLISGLLLFHVSITFLEMFVGAFIGTSTAIAVGFMLSSSRLLSEAFMPFISALYGIPRIALAPLFIMWFGIDIESKIALVSVVVFFLVFFNAFVGAREVDRVYLDTVKIMGASKWEIFRFVIVPHSAGWIFVGLKYALPRALVAAVVAEIVSSNRGLGYLLENSGSQFDVAGIFVAVFVMAIVGIVLNALVNHMELLTSRYRFLDD